MALCVDHQHHFNRDTGTATYYVLDGIDGSGGSGIADNASSTTFPLALLQAVREHDNKEGVNDQHHPIE